jgi:membrane protease YdiL (CAAX protease family)
MMNNGQYDVSGLRVHKHRLQRGPTDSGYRVETFGDVIKRHGGTMGLLAAACLLLPSTWSALSATTAPLFQQPFSYFLGALGLLLFFVAWSSRRPVSVGRQVQWVFYLLFISFVEELTFRLVLPALLEPKIGWLIANLLCGALFAILHYVTLRWKLRNCIATFIGAMGLSHLMSQGDFTLVVMVHWLGTFLNTPFPPKVKHLDD